MVKNTLVIPEPLVRDLNALHDQLLVHLEKEPLDDDARLEVIELQEALLNLLARVRVITS